MTDTTADVTAAAKALMPDVLDRLDALVRIPSVAFPGFDPEPVHRMGQAVVELFEAAGAVEANPDPFACDAAVIADIGGQEVGRPGLTVALRGDVACAVTVRTLEHPVHSGEFGGAAPDAMTAMIRILDTLHDENGDTVIPGVDSGRWDGAAMDEPVYQEGSAILPGVDFLGTGSLADRIWMKPSVTVLGMDLPNTAQASNAYGRRVESIGSGASIPLVASLKKVSPDAAILLWGAEDTKQSRIHASDESVDPDEIERMIVTQALFIREFAAAM